MYYCVHRFNILVSPGAFPYEEINRFLRIGILGYNARPEVVDKLLNSMAAVLQIIRDETKVTGSSESRDYD